MTWKILPNTIQPKYKTRMHQFIIPFVFFGQKKQAQHIHTHGGIERMMGGVHKARKYHPNMDENEMSHIL